MSRQQPGALAVKFDFLVDTDVNLRKVVLVERTLQYLSTVEDVLCLQFTLRTEHIPACIQLLVLCVDGLGLLIAFRLKIFLFLGEGLLLRSKALFFRLQRRNVRIQPRDGLVKFLDMDIFRLQFGTELLQVRLLAAQLVGQLAEGLLHGIPLEARLAQLLLQLLDQFAVLLHALGDELDILLHLRSLVRPFTVLRNRYPVLGLVDLGKALLDIVQRAHHVIDFIVTCTDDRAQGVILYLGRIQCRLLVLIAGCQCKSSTYCHY